MDFTIKNGGSFNSYVKLPEGNPPAESSTLEMIMNPKILLDIMHGIFLGNHNPQVQSSSSVDMYIHIYKYYRYGYEICM